MSDFIYGKSPEASWWHLHENGLQRATDVESNDSIAEKPNWLDEQRFKRAKKVVKTFRIGLSYSSLTGLLGILQVPGALEPLLSTGKSKDIPSLNKRYLDTLIHVESWYDDDIFDPSTKGYKSIRLVRGMHKRVQYNMNNNFYVTMEGKPRIWYNDFDCAMTQFAFIGMAMLHPKKCGLIAATAEDLEDINYYWRVLGYMMGMKDEFNLCQFDYYEDIHSFCQMVYDKETPLIKLGPKGQGLQMAQAICLALEYYLPLTSFNNLAHWWQDSISFFGYEPEPMTLHQRFLHYTTILSFNHMFANRSILSISTKIFTLQLKKRIKNRDKIHEKLKKKYENDSKWTFYSEKVDYFAEKPSKANLTASNCCSKDSKELVIVQKDIGEQQVVGSQEIGSEVTTIRSDDRNNSSLEQVISKPAGCPFGFGSG